ncbi:hypothetical protein L6452_39564 [Arctium lappa]|uniref:Uncharacterized protein n=1 Tax=Arctium lappa TaxID=4217 RepID=A0ACB8XTI8_ARCLA|nr:hypothetical protein L6452_39564 [Arctium lappa]
MSSRESRKSNVSISDAIDVSEGDQFPPHSTEIGLDDALKNFEDSALINQWKEDAGDEDELKMVEILERTEKLREDGQRRRCFYQKRSITNSKMHSSDPTTSVWCPADHYDEYLRVAKTTDIQCLNFFCQCVIQSFGEQYLRKPNAIDIQRLLQMHEEKHGFPGMLGSLDCMYWEWKNCPVGWKGQYTRGDHGVPTIILEAVVSTDLWIWHAFFGIAGSRNDINVLNESNLFNNVLRGEAPQVNFIANGTQYTKGYYLTDGIYPEWATFVKSFPCPQDAKRKFFKKRQEGARKDVERAFGVLQARWSIVKGPSRMWYKEHMKIIMEACIILHNMIVEDESDIVLNWTDDDLHDDTQIFQGSTNEFQQYLQRT